MSHEGINNKQESPVFKDEIKKLIERYTLLDDKMHENEVESDARKILEEERRRQIEEIVQVVVSELKKSGDKKKVLDEFTEAFWELYKQRLPKDQRIYEDYRDEVTDDSAQAEFLRKIILSIAT